MFRAKLTLRMAMAGWGEAYGQSVSTSKISIAFRGTPIAGLVRK